MTITQNNTAPAAGAGRAVTDTTGNGPIADDGVTSSPLDIPYTVDVTHSVSDVTVLAASVDAGEDTATVVTVAGRVRARRHSGGLLFADIEDQTGRAQLMADASSCEEFDQLAARRVGDWIAVRGTVRRTRSGEPTVRVSTWQLLAHTELTFPDTSHTLSNTDQRWRQRYVDLWVSPHARRVLQARSQTISAIRHELDSDGFMEVETPILQPVHGGANARPFVTHHHALDRDMTLRVAPELYLKRLVVAGCERVFELGRVFRNEGISVRHNPEFTMIEIYQAYADHHDMMDLTERLVRCAAVAVADTTQITWQGHSIDLGAPWRRVSMRELVAEHTGVDFGAHLDAATAVGLAADLGVDIDGTCGWGRALAEVFDRHVERTLIEPTFVCEHPVEVSPLARRHRHDPTVTERFEAIVAGRELCNAFTELVDPVEQHGRMTEQAGLAADGDDEAMAIDLDYIRALAYGLPPTGGLGIGIDRLVMLLTDTHNIRETIAFPTTRDTPTTDRQLNELLDRTPTPSQSSMDRCDSSGER